MPLVHGIGNEVLYAALAAAATPLAIALSPTFLRRQPLSLLARGASSVSRLLRLLWAQLRLGLLRRVQRVLASLASRRSSAGGQLTGRGIRQRLHGAGAADAVAAEHSDASSSASPECSRSRREDACSPGGSFPREEHSGGEEKEVDMEGSIRSYFGGAAPAQPSEQPARVSEREQVGAAPLLPVRDGLRAPPALEFCSVCHDDFTLPCQSNCGHWFCAECILRVWHHSSGLVPCNCPICRRTVTLLVLGEGQGSAAEAASAAPSVTSSSSNSPELRTVQDPKSVASAAAAGGGAGVGAARRLELVRDVAKYNRLFGGVPVSLWQWVLDMPMLLRRMGRDLVDPARALSLLHNLRFAVCTVCVGVYVLSPMDILSEGVLGVLGLVDDLVFLVCAAFYLTVLYRALLLSRASAWPTDAAQQQAQ